jgi:hypothetical protein
MSSRIDTYSSFKGLVIPVLSALTFSSDGTAQLNVCNMDDLPSIISPVQIEQSPKTYSGLLDTRSNNTVEINSNVIDLLVIKSFAENYLNSLVPIEESIQAVIDDYFWEML